jgi:2-methylisocitrate lyase-like PEP mutase family enzyme
MTQQEKAEKFKAMHREGIFVLPNAWDVASACVLADVGYQAIATTSGGCAFSMGFCDGEHIGRDGMAEVVRRMAGGVSIPVSADMEAGYGPTTDDVAMAVKAALDAGAVGVNIEDGDKSGPRRLHDLDLAISRVKAARKAADDFGIPAVINARTDGYMLGSEDDMFDETVRRANAYLEAGADCAFVIGARDGELIGRLAASIDGPMNVLAGPGTPPVAELGEMGVRRVTVGGNIAKAAYTLVKTAAQEMLDSGTYEYAAGVYSQPEMHRIIKGE